MTVEGRGALTLAETAAWLGVSLNTVERLVSVGILPTKRLGLGGRRRHCVSLRYLEDFMASDATTLEEFQLSRLDTQTVSPL